MKAKCDFTAKDAKGTKEIFRGMPWTSRFSFALACGDLIMDFLGFPSRSLASFAVKRP